MCLLWLVPVAGPVVTSLRSPDAARTTGWWTVLWPPFDPTQFTLDGYRLLWSPFMAAAFVNSVAIVVPAVLLPIAFATAAAYAFSFMQFSGRRHLYALLVLLLIVPPQITLVPLLRMYVALDLNGTFAAVYLAHAAFGLPLAVLILRHHMLTLPTSLIEAARVDGASQGQTFWRIVLPLCGPAIAAFATFQFLATWNDYLLALIFIGQGERAPVTIALAGQVGATASPVTLVGGAALITVSVPVLVFVTMQRYFVRGMTGGAVNG